MDFWKMLESANNITRTENGDLALKSSMSGLVDLMYYGGNGRSKETTVNEIENVVKAALCENVVAAIRLIFYNRDIRGGQGARRFFRIAFNFIARNDTKLAKEILGYIPEYGRWDDMFDIFKYNAEQNSNVYNVQGYIIDLIKEQLLEDAKNLNENKSISLLSKWLPSENASSKDTKNIAYHIISRLHMTPRNYRKMLSKFRNYLKIVEHNIVNKTYSEINYEFVPSKALMKYRSAIVRNDGERYQKYLQATINGKAKINASTLYPFDIIKNYYNKFDQTLEVQWKALPDFLNGRKDNSIVIADVSGSMSGDPINACIGLAIYIAQHNKGEFYNKFITFSANPTLQNIKGDNLYENIQNLSCAQWDMNTDLNKVFELIYNTMVSNNLTKDEMPSMLYIVSDMQFDVCCDGVSTYDFWRNKFNEYGVKLPTVVFWNVSNNINTVPVEFHESGTILVSGYSPAICKFIMECNENTTPLDLVLKIVNSDRYNSIL